MAKTRLSRKGHVTIRKEMRERHGWRAGAELEIEDREDSVVLRAALAFPRTTVAQVFGCLEYEVPLTVEQMNTAVAREARRRP